MRQAAGGRPVLLTGAGDSFSAGLDLREVVQLEALPRLTVGGPVTRVVGSVRRTILIGTAGTTGTIYGSNADLNFYAGAGIAYPFAGNFNPRIWSGNISLDLRRGQNLGEGRHLRRR